MGSKIMLGLFVIGLMVLGTVVIVSLSLYLLFFESRRDKAPARNAPDNCEDPKDMEQLYDMILERIAGANGTASSILFASTDTRTMPVTIPVNTAIRLARDNRKCLLIDLDTRRDAIAAAFGIEQEKGDPKPHKTDIENLSVWPAHYFQDLQERNLPLLVEAAEKKYDYVLISAPRLANHPQRGRIAASAQIGVLFSDNVKQASRLASLIKLSRCRLVCHIHVSDRLLASGR